MNGCLASTSWVFRSFQSNTTFSSMGPIIPSILWFCRIACAYAHQSVCVDAPCTEGFELSDIAQTPFLDEILFNLHRKHLVSYLFYNMVKITHRRSPNARSDNVDVVVSCLRPTSTINYKWNEGEWYKGKLVRKDHKSKGGYWWHILWELDNTEMRVNLSPSSYAKGNWRLLGRKAEYNKRKIVSSGKRAKKLWDGTSPDSTISNLSEYEINRLKRIEENKAELLRLGITPIAKEWPSLTPKAKPKQSRLRPRREKQPRSGWRTSRRLKGRNPAGKMNPKNIKVNYELERKRHEKESYEELLELWKKDKNLKATGKSERQLFMVPTGILGYNDHTLEDIVPQVGTYLWGFAQGLYSRIFSHIRAGDILLFTSCGTGKFNRVGIVKEKRVVNQGECDKFWSRMDYNMGSGPKTNVGFPLLVPLKGKPVSIDWDKEETLAMCGYSDRLQSSRRILMDREGARLVRAKCIRSLNLKS